MKHSNNNKENYNKNNYFIKKNNLFARNYEENKLFIGLSCHLLGAFHYFLSDFCNYWFLLLEFASSWNFRVSFCRREKLIPSIKRLGGDLCGHLDGKNSQI